MIGSLLGRPFVAALVALAFTGSAGEVWADTGDLIEVAGRAAYVTPPIHDGVNPFGGGFGARAGLVLSGFYVGGTFMDFLGGSDGGATDKAVLLGAEVGYGFRLSPYLTVRPRLGVGDAILTHAEPSSGVDVVTSASGSSGSTATTKVANVYLQPGASALFSWRHYFVAIDFDVLVVPGIIYGPAPAEPSTWLSYSLGGALGLRF